MKRVGIFIFPGAQLLDAAGPASVFGEASIRGHAGAYEVVLVSSTGGEIRTDCGVGLATRSISKVAPRSLDTLIVSGGGDAAITAALRDPVAATWVKKVAVNVRRLTSVCSGAFLLVDWGLVDGRRIATHWRATSALRTREPRITVDAEALFIEDGRVWTSAGVTTGIDMSLAMVERDLGSDVAQRIARDLVLYARRPGHQSQFSALLEAQGGPYTDLIVWIGENLEKPLEIEQLAERAGQSPRTFHRKFAAAVGRTPAVFVERLRLNRARMLLEAGEPMKSVASACGFGSLDRMGRAFKTGLGLLPSTYRALHGEQHTV